MQPTPAEVLDVFAELTGIRFRRVPDTVLRQAGEFAKDFTFEEMERVIAFTRWQMKTGGVSYNAQSLTWGKLMGDYGASDAFMVFQERLGLACEATKRGTWHPRLRYRENTLAPVATPIAAPVASAPADYEEKRARILKQFEQFTRPVGKS